MGSNKREDPRQSQEGQGSDGHLRCMGVQGQSFNSRAVKGQAEPRRPKRKKCAEKPKWGCGRVLVSLF